MPFKVPKEDLPQMSFTPARYNDELVMFAIAQGGLWAFFTELDTVVLVPWDEVIAYAATTPAKEPDAPKPEKKTVREVPKPAKP